MTLNRRVNLLREPVIEMRVRGPQGVTVRVTSLIDTGFSGARLLPTRIIYALDLPVASTRKTVLGDGTTRNLTLHDAELTWMGQWRPVVIHASGGVPLVGSGLLEGHRLQIDFAAGGPVAITPLP
jgi:clan AA aspartic protease